MAAPLRPPTWVAPTTRTPLPIGRRGKRAVLAQCDRCGCNGTARVNGNGRIVSINLAADSHPAGRWLHRDCGGTFLAYDIEVDG